VLLGPLPLLSDHRANPNSTWTRHVSARLVRAPGRRALSYTAGRSESAMRSNSGTVPVGSNPLNADEYLAASALPI
jgi:hypothetical protein